MILVLGASGQLGRSLIEEAGRTGVPLVGHTREETDITEAERVRYAIKDLKPTLVVNAAAYTNVDRAESEPDVAEMANAIGPAVVAAATSDAGVPIVQISTDYVFDGRKSGAYRENDRIAPMNVYGRTKARGEQAVRRANSRHFIIRTSWLYSPYGQNFLKTILRLAMTRDELRVVSDQHGSPTSATDLADAILRVADRLVGDGIPFGTYHFAGRGSTSWYGLAVEIVNRQAESTGRRPSVIPIGTADYPTAARRPVNSALDSSRFASVFDCSGAAWQAGVRSVVDRLLLLEVMA